MWTHFAQLLPPMEFIPIYTPGDGQESYKLLVTIWPLGSSAGEQFPHYPHPHLPNVVLANSGITAVLCGNQCWAENDRCHGLQIWAFFPESWKCQHLPFLSGWTRAWLSPAPALACPELGDSFFQ